MNSNLNTSLVIAAPTVVLGYGIYRLGKLPDAASHERMATAAALAGSIALIVSSITIDASPTKAQLLRRDIGAGIGAGALAYLTTRVVFKKSITAAVVVGIFLAAGVSGYTLFDQTKLLPKSKNDAAAGDATDNNNTGTGSK